MSVLLAAAASVVTLYCDVEVVKSRRDRAGFEVTREQGEPTRKQYVFTVNYGSGEVYVSSGPAPVSGKVLRSSSMTSGKIVLQTFEGISHNPARGKIDLTEQDFDRQTGRYRSSWTSGIDDVRLRISVESKEEATGLCKPGKMVSFPSARF